ncbi:hypothetical protein HBH56_176610 [Parastagonospora nodorum]|uniref:Heterokaryon incompatibility domain-containing protein n=1 Tax=Phaeosphaeria nodorum (strain SN15 / ATCC MYA-4574 / FGSC 10173) TaxID=321614 RepID=A0A7U2EZY6_PHANO|nr:hypothetical protein HBH56_176610 [Parastagonospora nodorum]QRC96176.1 hypothetical protein JI435_011380 [Parastagonospora nodorum SN15]KAH3926460.1 hypothetical protein HBH54_166550 [Parastagonospora nodorum]KAH4134032.1 hypothetical protein HBH45_170260 [Parastagonospora nodorum]KAH4152305.1 hypothetical protein HBH44_165390 [Parastagonospora nodorum]
MTGKQHDMARYKEHNRMAVADNSQPIFTRAEDSKEPVQDVILSGSFVKSGLIFKTDPNKREVFVVDRADDPILPIAKPIIGNTGSMEAMRAASKWFVDCVKGHNTMCPTLVSPDGPPQLPFRIIDVGTNESTDVRLLHKNGEFGYWACLSHCWGGEQPLQTTRDSLTRHQNVIYWRDLPRTFQDAVFVTRAFGIPYLWIDSLCIVQDDLDDWQVQSAKMADIYQYSILTIAASASSGPSQGIFRNAGPEYMDKPIVDVLGDTTLTKVRIRKALSHSAAELPLLGRGWVHQERLLSPRILHFGHNEMIWECMECLACECGHHEGRYNARSPSLLWPTSKEMFHPYFLKPANLWIHMSPPVWQRAVEDYSRMALSKPEDIFPAISGLAKILQNETGWEYVAGLWKETLIVDLVWSTRDPHMAIRCAPWRAPTFSWASVQSRTSTSQRHSISYRHMSILQSGLQDVVDTRRRTDFYATLMKTSYTPLKEDDPTGRVQCGYIILKGTLTRAALCRSTSTHEWYITAIGKERYQHNHFNMDFDLDNDGGRGQPEGSQDVHCLRLIGQRKDVPFEDEEFLVYLVLKQVKMKSPSAVPTPGLDPLVFERVGVLVNWRGEVQLEDESDASAILHDSVVKIV